MVNLNRLAVTALLASALILTGCSKTLNVDDLELTEDLTDVVEAETGSVVTDVSCPDTLEDPEAGTTFDCDVEAEDGSTVTVHLELEQDEDDTFRATYQGID